MSQVREYTDVSNPMVLVDMVQDGHGEVVMVKDKEVHVRWNHPQDARVIERRMKMRGVTYNVESVG